MSSEEQTPKQEPLFELTAQSEDFIKTVRPTRWYFVGDAKSRLMVIQRSCGRYQTIEYDLRFMIPWLTNRKMEAQRVANLHTEWKVKNYPYDPSKIGAANNGRGGWRKKITGK